MLVLAVSSTSLCWRQHCNLTISNAASFTAAGNLTLNDFITNVQPYTVTMTGVANTFTQAIDFTNTGLVTLGDDAVMSLTSMVD